MKRVLLILLGLFIFGVLVLYITATNSGVQTAVVRAILKDSFGEDTTIGSFRFTPGRLYISDLESLSADDAIVSMERLEVRFRVRPLFGGNVFVNSIALDNLVLDLRNVKTTEKDPKTETEQRRVERTTERVTRDPSDVREPTIRADRSSPDPVDYDEIIRTLESLKFPQRVQLGSLNMSGKVLLPEDGVVNFSVSGGDFRSGQDASIQSQIHFSGMTTEDFPVQNASFKGKFAFASDADGQIRQLSFQSESSALLADFPESPVSLTTLFRIEISEENIVSLLANITAPAFERSSELLIANLVLNPNEKSVTGDWSLNVSSLDARPWLGDLEIPEGTIAGRGILEVRDQDAKFSSELNVDASNLQILDPAFANHDTVRFTSVLSGEANQERAFIESLATTLEFPQGQELFSFLNLQPIEFDQSEEKVHLADSSLPLFRLALASLPFDLIDVLVPEMSISAGNSGAEFELFFDPNTEAVSLLTKTPFFIENLSLANAEGPLLEQVSLSLTPFLKAQNNEAEFGIEQLSITDASGDLVSLQQKMYASPDAAEGIPEFLMESTGEVNLAGLLRQPLLADLNNLNQGNLNYSLTAKALPPKVDLILNTRFTDGIIASTGESIGTLALDFKVEAEELNDDEGKVSLMGPLTLTVGDRVSDLNVDSSFSLTEDLISGVTSLQSTLLDIDDFQRLAEAFSPPREEAPLVERIQDIRGRIADFRAEKEPVEEKEEFSLEGIAADFSIKLEQVRFQQIPLLTDFSFQSRLDRSGIQIETLEARLREAVLGVSGGLLLRDQPDQPPFRLGLGLQLANLDLGRLLRELQPDRKPTLDTTLSLNGRIASDGPDLGAVLRGIGGQFAVEAGEGKLRALRREGTSGTAASIGGAVLGAVGRRSGEGSGAQAVNEIADLFAEIPFEQFRMQLEREPSDIFGLSDLLIIGRDLKIEGAGFIRPEEDTAITESPLELRLNLAARNRLANQFARLGLVGEADEQEFRALTRPVTIRGTLTRPDATSLWTLLAEAAIRSQL